MKNQENELKILELISQGKDDISQRDISRIIGMSLGMTNSILKRFAEKGLITIRKVNNRNIHYALTSEGIEEVGRRSWRYFKRTIKNVVVYREAINEIILEAIDEGYESIALVGESDLAFIVEHESYKLDIPFYMIGSEDGRMRDKCFYFLAETNLSNKAVEDMNINYSLNNLVF